MRAGLPRYQEILWRLQAEILTGALPPGSPIPPVRSLAGIYRANPNTVQRALESLRRRGLLIGSRGKSPEVTCDAALLLQLRR